MNSVLLKKLVRTVLKEIKLANVEHGRGLGNFFNYMQSSMNNALDKNPANSIPKNGYAAAYSCLRDLRTSFTNLIVAVIKNNKKETEKSKTLVQYNQRVLFQFMNHWGGKFYNASKDDKTKDEIIRTVNELARHLNESFNQLDIIEKTLLVKNYAVAQEQISHLKEITDNVAGEIDEIFSLGKL